MSTSNKPKLSIRDCILLQNLWKVPKEDTILLDRFFLLWDSPSSFFNDLKKNDHPKYPFHSEYNIMLDSENTIWQVHFMQPWGILKKMGKNELALSCRENKASSFNWILVNRWQESNPILTKEEV